MEEGRAAGLDQRGDLVVKREELQEAIAAGLDQMMTSWSGGTAGSDSSRSGPDDDLVVLVRRGVSGKTNQEEGTEYMHSSG